MLKEAVSPKSTTFKTALVQMEPSHLNVDKNRREMVRLIDEAAREGARLIVFPELAVTGYVGPYSPQEFQGFYEASEPVPGPTTKLIEMAARQKGAFIIFGMAERGESPLGPVMHNVSVLVGPDGYIGRHRKIHLPGGEKLYFRPGDEVEVYDTGLGKIALLVCYDFWFPETSRIAALKGAEIVVDSANWPAFDTDVWYALGPGNAASNVLWLVQVNRLGGEDYWPGFGGSQIVDPSGKVTARGTDEQTIVYGEIDTALVVARRMVTPVLFDRRPELYEASTKFALDYLKKNQ